MRASIATIIILFFISLFLQSMGADGARVGIIGLGAQTQNGVDFLTTSLSKRPGVVLLERTELDQLTSERVLTLAQSVDRGRLLGADALLFLESSPSGTNRSASLRLVGVKQGVVLYSTKLSWPPK